jgi:hypothetical protein
MSKGSKRRKEDFRKILEHWDIIDWGRDNNKDKKNNGQDSRVDSTDKKTESGPD